MRKVTIEIIVNDDITFRDIERALNELDAETTFIDLEEVEE